MFAGGRVQTTGHLRYGEPASRHIFVRNSTEKRGGSGRLTFVTVAHEISQAGQVVIAEEQDIVYRDAATAKHQGSTSRPNRPESARSEASAPVEANEWQIDVDPVLLFGFSALTHNSHRIHYDREYAREVEGYPALVVHGPLQTILMAEGARRLNPTLARPTRFEYRMVSPLFDHEGLVVSAVATRDGIDTVSRAADGRITALGTLIFSA